MTLEADSSPNTESVLRKLFLSRRLRNPRYSVRALARDLGVSHSYVSLAMNGKRNFSPVQLLKLATLAELPAREQTKLFLSAALKKEKNAKARPSREMMSMELDRFQVLEQWYHLPILDLTLLKTFKSDPKWIAKALGISVRSASSAIARLKRLGMLIEVDGRLTKVHEDIHFPTSRSMPVVREFHRSMIGKALSALDRPGQSDFARRDITAMTMPADPSRLPQAKRMIEEFRARLMRFLSEGDCTDLLQLNIQVFPLTREVKSGPG